MGMVRDCNEFDHLWNDRLDHREHRSLIRDQDLADHAAQCATCHCHALVYRDLERLLPAGALLPAPTPAASERWRGAAMAARQRSMAATKRRRVRRLIRWGLPIASAAGILLIGRAVMPLFWPTRPIPVLGSSEPHLSPLFKEAITEASTMTWELAREISVPADRLGSQALGAKHQPLARSTLRSGDESGERSAEVWPTLTPPPAELHRVGLAPEPARHAFRYLGNSDAEDVIDPEMVEGY